MKDLVLINRIKALPADVFAAFTNKRIIEIWTGEPAEMELTEGFNFSWFNGDISGVIVGFEADKRLVQLWDFGDNPKSEVVILFIPEGKGSRLEIRQKGIPDDDYENIKEGWIESVFESLKELLEE